MAILSVRAVTLEDALAGALGALGGMGCGHGPIVGTADTGLRNEPDAMLVVDAGEPVSVTPASGMVDANTVDAADAAGPDASVGTFGHKCGSSPMLLAPAPELGVAIAAVAVHDPDVFYTGDAGIMKIPVGGGTPSLFTTLLPEPMVATSVGLVVGGGTIAAVPYDGGAPVTLATPNAWSTALTVDDENVYFSDGAGTKSVPLAGGPVQPLTSQTGSLARVGSDLIIVSGDTIYSVPAAGGPLATLASGQPGAAVPVACGNDACWMTSVQAAPPGGLAVAGNGYGTIMRLAVGGTPAEMLTSWALPLPQQLVFDGADFYVSQGVQSGSVFRISGAGGFPVFVGSGLGIVGVAVDDECVYWASVDRGLFTQAKTSFPTSWSWDASSPPGSGTCRGPDAGAVYCEQSLSCTEAEASTPSCDLGADASPCGSFSCGAGCTCADAQSNACACVTP
jgi:hypothetical protein